MPLTFRTLRRRTGTATTGASKPRSHSRRWRPQSTLRRWRSRRRSPTKVSPRSASLRSFCRARRSCRYSARCRRRARTPMCAATSWRAFPCSTVRASFMQCTPQPPGSSSSATRANLNPARSCKLMQRAACLRALATTGWIPRAHMHALPRAHSHTTEHALTRTCARPPRGIAITRLICDDGHRRQGRGCTRR